MSHLSKVQVAIRDIDVLGEALRAIGLRRVAEVPENYEFAGTFNTCDVQSRTRRFRKDPG